MQFLGFAVGHHLKVVVSGLATPGAQMTVLGVC